MKKIIILFGPKGAGKSTIGQLLEAGLNIHFLPVEPLFLKTRAALGPQHPGFEKQGFESVLAALREALSRDDVVCIESTGASEHLAWFLAELALLAEVCPVRVLAHPEQCLERIRTRDTALHIPVPDDQIERINARAVQVALPWAAQIDNRGPLDRANACSIISSLLSQDSHTIPDGRPGS